MIFKAEREISVWRRAFRAKYSVLFPCKISFDSVKLFQRRMGTNTVWQRDRNVIRFYFKIHKRKNKVNIICSERNKMVYFDSTFQR